MNEEKWGKKSSFLAFFSLFIVIAVIRSPGFCFGDNVTDHAAHDPDFYAFGDLNGNLRITEYW